MALFGSTYLIPVFMQIGLGLSASYVGTILLPAGVVLAVTIAVTGRLADRYPTHVLVSVGVALLAASFALMVLIKSGAAIGLLVALATLGRIGLGCILPSLNLGAMRGTDKALIPQGASVINFIRMLGGSVGVSLCGIVLEWRLAVHGASLHDAQHSAARLAAFDESFVLLAVLCALALLASWRLRAPAAPATGA
jgi:predicted MFS family arabinose efflux permease